MVSMFISFLTDLRSRRAYTVWPDAHLDINCLVFDDNNHSGLLVFCLVWSTIVVCWCGHILFTLEDNSILLVS